MSRGYGKCERAILAVLEAWSPFPLMKLLPGKRTRAQVEALKRAARGLAKKGEIDLAYDDRGRLVILKASPREVQYQGEMIDGVIVPRPNVPPPVPGQVWKIKVGDDKFNVIKFGRKLHRGSLSRADADRLAGHRASGRAPEWGEREAELDRLYEWGDARDSTRGWRQGEAEPDWENALLERAHRIVADRKDHLETQKRLERERALWDAVEDDRRRGRKWRKGPRPRGDEENFDDEGPCHLPDEKGRRGVDAVTAIAAQEGGALRLTAEPAGTITHMQQEHAERELEELEQTEQERQQGITQDEFKDQERERYASMERPAADDGFEPPDDDDPDDGAGRQRRGRQPPP